MILKENDEWISFPMFADRYQGKLQNLGADFGSVCETVN